MEFTRLQPHQMEGVARNLTRVQACAWHLRSGEPKRLPLPERSCTLLIIIRQMLRHLLVLELRHHAGWNKTCEWRGRAPKSCLRATL